MINTCQVIACMWSFIAHLWGDAMATHRLLLSAVTVGRKFDANDIRTGKMVWSLHARCSGRSPAAFRTWLCHAPCGVWSTVDIAHQTLNTPWRPWKRWIARVLMCCCCVRIWSTARRTTKCNLFRFVNALQPTETNNEKNKNKIEKSIKRTYTPYQFNVHWLPLIYQH